MNIWKRTLIYLRRNNKRCILLLIILTAIASALTVCLAVWKSTKEGIDDLRKTYGNAFSMEISFTDSSKEDSTLWEPFINEFGAEEYRYLGPSLNDELIEKVMSVDGIEDVCKEQEEYLYFKDIEFIPGLHTQMIEMEKNDPELLSETDNCNPALSAKNNTLRGYNSSHLSSFFRTKSFELVSGKEFEYKDRNKIMISDALAEKNQLSLGDVIHGELTESVINGGDPNHVYAETNLEIVGIFHVNINQVVSEYTVEQDIAENFMIADLHSVKEMRRAYFDVMGINKEPAYQKVTFFINEPKEMDNILKKVKEIGEVDWHAFEIKPDDTAYQSSITPLQSMSKIAIFMIVFILIVCIILLALILRMWLGTRKKEMGILLSMGNSRRGIIGQLILEGMILLTAALILSCAVSAGISNKAGNAMLSGINAQEERKAGNAEEAVGEPPAAAEDMAAYSEQFTIKTEVEAPKEIECSITIYMVLIVAGMLTFVLIITTVFTAGKILKMKPKEILSML